MPKIFISSTFQDMHVERDALQLKLVPQINEKLAPYGDSLDLIDLRWGIDTNDLDDEESNKKVLQVCLDEIDKAKPYVIVLIGERYGWIPPKYLIDAEIEKKGSKISDDISVTNLEIEYAALLNSDCNVFFYFRNPFDMTKMPEFERNRYQCESDIHKKKLEALKEKIKARYPDKIRYYDVSYDEAKKGLIGIDNLINLIYSDLIDNLLADAKTYDELSNLDKIITTSDKYFKSYYIDTYMTKDVSKKIMVDELYKDNKIEKDITITI